MEITAAKVKELRDLTGVGMMDCKKALQETNGDMEAAVDWLRTRGLAKAAKKAGRVAAEGLVGVAIDGTRGAIVEVNSETDFVARNEQFQTIVGNIAKLALEADGDVARLSEMPYPGSGRSVSGELTDAIATIGENMNLRRTASISVSDGVIGNYVHNTVKPGLGKLGIIVGLESTGNKDALAALGKQIAMHIANTNPLSVSPEDLDPTVVARERAVFTEQAKESGKPAEIIEKMVEGRVRKFYEEVTLLAQTFVIDGETKISDVLKNAEKEVGASIKLTAFVRYALGEGIEKEETDFAAEVAAAAGA
ncbi:translation elongation factor Ts [Paradevosia shaoguanensis]|uniref:Elongation factor Ts n=1 Tax=Paradevosia shaoguanensis TaxID=1335043 RepID=A0AA41UAW6_9HYPH|nr:translation elongation factor Ts [Paradevosia shaoguanensis]MCF1742355.1 translation elongation factor Ts [Paradevosia shaoguanensis]MCI0126838.1 translation elongation factor Ts [Paradevosia shaoguanensis]QMV02270.1 elongation factor Ts [Devosia sp. D6-9]CDP54269.1 Translation elongation factor Ts [Devosia sp. DBB001]